jgi:3-oxoacyl-[acyl-carrier-protein] synthase II
VGDINELLAIKSVFAGGRGPAVSSTKSMTGHLLGAAGALESVLSIQAIQHSLIPPTINLHSADDFAEGIDLVANRARERRISYVMNNSFGFGGTNATLVFKRLP